MKFKRTVGLLLSFVMVVSSLNIGYAVELNEIDVPEITTKDKVLSENERLVEIEDIEDTEVKDLRAASSTDIVYPVEGGNTYFALSTGTITDADATITKADIPSKINGVMIGKESYNTDVAPYIQTASNSTIVPLRFVAHAIAAEM